MSEEGSKSDAVVLWSQEEVAKYKRRARFLAAHPERLDEYAANEFMEQTILLGQTAKKLLAAAGQEKGIDAAKMAVAGAKVNAAWREMSLPLIKRLWKGAEKKNGRGRQAEQIPAASGSGAGSERAGRGGAGESGSDPDSVEDGGTGEMEG